MPMHLLAALALALAIALFLDRSRIRASGLSFVLKDYARQISHRVTIRRIVYVIGILLFVYGIWQLLGIDVAAFSVGAETMMYLEIVSTVYLIAARGTIRQATAIAARTIAGVMRKSIASLRSRRRDRRSPRHYSSHDDGSDGDGEAASRGAFAFAA